MGSPNSESANHLGQSEILTANGDYEARKLRAVTLAIAAAWDDAMEVGCMEHGGYEVLAEAAVKAVRDVR